MLRQLRCLTVILAQYQVADSLTISIDSSRLEQRQVIRCLLISPVFAIVSWVGFRFVRYYIYFQLIRDMYEAFCLAAFCAL